MYSGWWKLTILVFFQNKRIKSSVYGLKISQKQLVLFMVENVPKAEIQSSWKLVGAILVLVNLF
jgi:hypothetical protein